MSKYRAITRVNAVVIHCAATPNGRWTTASDIDDWHKKREFGRHPDLIGVHEPNLKHIGYHHVLYTSGAMANGRRYCETGAHAIDPRFPQGDLRRHKYNHHAIGLCLIGTDQFTLAQWTALRQFVLLTRQDIPQLKVIGHNKINPQKTCPGFDVQAWLDNDMMPMEGHILDTDSPHG